MQSPDEHTCLDLLPQPLIQERGFALALRGPPGGGAGLRLERRQLNAVGLQRSAEATAHVFRCALPFLLCSLEQRCSQSALGLEEYSFRKYF